MNSTRQTDREWNSIVQRAKANDKNEEAKDEGMIISPEIDKHG